MTRRFGMRSWLALVCVSVAWSACASSPSTTQRRSQPSPQSAAAASSTTNGSTGRRQHWAEMFGRGYFPGRSGQIFVVPREGDIITTRDPLYRFMHGSPWEYDVRIPFLLYGAPYIQRGSWPDAVTQQDMAPTLAAVLGTAPAGTMTGRALTKALAHTTDRPRVVALLVLDGMRVDYFDKYADAMPTLSRMRTEGAWFSDARLTALPSVTSVGHANIGTGTEPRIHGQSSNTIFNYVADRAQPAYWELDPTELNALAIGDLWNIATDGKAVIVGQGGAIRATAGLVGHGSCIVNGRTVIAASYDANPKGNGGWETNPTCYRLSKALEPITARPYWERAGGTWMGHDIASPTSFRASSLFQRFEGDALAAILERETIGTDDVTDLVLVNMKGPDYTGHAYGPDSPEIRETLSELDRQVARLLETLEKKAGPGRSVIGITADHGMPGEPAAGRRHYGDDVAKLVHDRFDKEGRLIRLYATDTANSQLYLDRDRLRALGISLKDIAAFLETQDFIAAAFTEADVQAAMPQPR